ncbi:hypothetical protein DRQ53_05715 [bacterium]|nr:MAG: hypothetical protein DRQ53_05715 [bacterium]
MRSYSVLALLFFLLADAGPAVAGAWVQPPGASFLKAGALYSSTENRVDCHGEIEAAEPFGGAYRERKFFLYGEYGLIEELTLLGSFVFGEQEIVDAVVPDYGTRSTGDLRMGARWGLRRDPRWPLSVEAVLSVPTYPSTDPTLPVGEREQFLPSGSGTIEAELRLQAGVSFWPLPFYANLDGGYRSRGQPYGDQWLLTGEVGGSTGRFFGKVELRGIWPDGDPCSSSSAGAVSVHERSLRLGPEGSVRVAGNWWLGATWSTLLSGRNTLDNDQWLLSVSWARPGGGG